MKRLCEFILLFFLFLCSSPIALAEQTEVVYMDEETGATFAVPSGWREEPLSKPRHYLDVKFVSTYLVAPTSSKDCSSPRSYNYVAQTNSGYSSSFGITLLGVALWALLPGFIAKKKERSFWGFYFLSFIISPLISLIIILCIKKDGSSYTTPKIEKSKKFYCKNCSMFSSGWYQVCPNCGYAGSMVKTTETILFRERSKKQNQVTANTSSIQESTKSSAISLPDRITHSTETNLPVQFCRNCGAKLNPNAKYCLNCGTKTVVVNQEPPVESSVTESTAETKPNSPDPALLKLDLQDKNLPPLLRRAFLFIEDGEREKADEYLEKVLDEDPENAYAYLGKLLVEYKLEKANDIRSIMPQAKNSKNYEKVLRFADEKLKTFLSEIGAEEKATEVSAPAQIVEDEKDKLTEVLTYALKYSTTSGMKDYLHRCLEELDEKEKGILIELLENGEDYTLRARVQSELKENQ